jgi:hypothetical protein
MAPDHSLAPAYHGGLRQGAGGWAKVALGGTECIPGSKERE